MTAPLSTEDEAWRLKSRRASRVPDTVEDALAMADAVHLLITEVLDSIPSPWLVASKLIDPKS